VAGRVVYRGKLDELVGPPGQRGSLEQALRGLYEKGAAE
jgi:hypothetical protein